MAPTIGWWWRNEPFSFGSNAPQSGQWFSWIEPNRPLEF